MVYREDDEVRVYKGKSWEAIDLAMESRWAEAAALNRELVEINPGDIQAWNRLGKAAMELGEKSEAQNAFATSLRLDSNNSIAKKNLGRLASIPETKTRTAQGTPLASRMFMGDSGKSARVELTNCAPVSERPFISAGMGLSLEPKGGSLAVTTADGQLLGLLPAKVGRRLISLTQGGNTYQAAVASATDNSISVMVMETYRHPSQRAKISFLHSSVATDAAATRHVEDEAAAVAEAAARELNIAFVDGLAGGLGINSVGVGVAQEPAIIDDSMLPELPEEESA